MMSEGTWRLVMPRSESTMATAGRCSKVAWMAASMGARSSSGSFCRADSTLASPLLGLAPTRSSSVAVLVEDVGEEGPHGVAEDDRVGDLHHRGLEVQREEDALRLGIVELAGQEVAELRPAHHGGVEDLAGLQRDGGPQHRHRTVVGHVLDGDLGGRLDRHRLLVGAEVPGVHGGDVGLRVGRPGPQPVRVLLGVVLDRGGSPAVGVPLAEDGVDRAAGDLLVAGLDLPLLVGGGLVGVVGKGVALALQLGDGRLELREGGADVGQLDDVGLGPVHSSPSSARASPMRCSSVRRSGNWARMRPASEMSRLSTVTPAAAPKAWMIGRNERVARAGASSVWV